MKSGCFIFLLFFSHFAFSQKVGTPLLRYYSPAEYKGFSQNWCIAQDDRGVMYFGNGKGILEYNGKTWRRFPTELHTTVLCMVKGKDGRIYVGAENEIGYLAPDSAGLTQFISLNPKVSEKEKQFTYVWAAHATDQGICFVTGEKILCWDGKRMTYHYPKKSFFTSFCAGGLLYVIGTEEGLYVLKNAKLEFLRGTEELYEASVRFIGSAGQSIFIASRKGFYTYDDNGLKRIPSDADAFLKEKGLYKGAALADGSFALGTMSGGVMIVNSDGKILELIDESKGLDGKSVYALFVDREKELWLAQENGISRVSYSSPVRILDARHGVHGIIRALAETKEGFYAATFQGLYKLNARGTFDIVNNITTGVNLAAPYKNNSILICAGDLGMVEVKGNKTVPINPDPYVLSLQVNKNDSDYVVAGSVGKLYVFRNDKGNWSTVLTIDSLVDEINSVVQINDVFWCTTTNLGKMFSVKFKDATHTKYKLTAYDSSQGLPGGLLEAYAYKDELFVGSDKGVLRFDKRRSKFVQDSSLWQPNALKPPSYAYILRIDQNKNAWALTNGGFGYFAKGAFFNAPFRRIGFSDYYALLVETDGKAWLGGTNGIARYTPDAQKNYDISFPALITRVVQGKDTLFKGSFYTSEGAVSSEQNEHFKFTFPFRSNSLLFEYASPFFDAEESLLYSYKLDDFDPDWSLWTKETRKEYTNLPEGKYVFLIKAKNVYEKESSVARYEFTILAPWYRSWWAYVLYVVAVGLLIYLLIKIQTARLKRENEKLEKIVNERTAEVVRQKDEIGMQKEKLQAAYYQIEEKQKEILDSIHYAKRIQRSLLPTEKFIARHLGQLKKKS